MRLEESIPIFLEHVSAHNAEGTLEAYTQRLEKFRQFVGRRGVTRRVALEWINHLLSVERLSKRTVAHYRRTVRTFYAWLVENEFEKQNPVSKGSKLHPSSAPKPTFSDDEVARLLATARDTEFWEYGCRMGYDTGLRLSDVAEMEWQSVNFTTHSVKLMPRKTKRFEKIVEIPLSQATMDLLDKMKLAAGASQFVAPWMAMQFAGGSSPDALDAVHSPGAQGARVQVVPLLPPHFCYPDAGCERASRFDCFDDGAFTGADHELRAPDS
jgi:site-specific recombinase XerD